MGAALKQDLSQFAVKYEDIAHAYTNAGRGLRFSAAMMDSIMSNVFTALGVAFFEAAGLESPLFNFVWTVTIAFLWYVLPLYLGGQTVGKRIMKIKVICEDPKRELTLGLAMRREFVGKLAAAMAFMCGFAMILWDKENRAWYDKHFSTRVISTSD